MKEMHHSVDPADLDPKPYIGHVEHVEKGEASSSNQDIAHDNPEYLKRLKKLTLKIDIRVIPILGAMYSISGIDRTNLSNARVAGMDVDLGFNQGNRYSIALLVFFFTYFIFEIPSNIVLRKVPAHRYLAFLAFGWGVCIMCAGFAHNWIPIVIIRLLVGVFEAGFFPGCVYLISSWYERYQVQQRIAWFYAVNVVSNGFGNILAYGLIQMEGVGGLRGWRWIFVIEGLITVALAALGYALIVPFPDQVLKSRKPFLNEDEVQMITDRLNRDRSDAEFDEITWPKIKHCLLKWEIWLFALMFMSAAVGIYAFAFFSAIIIKSFGYSVSETFLLAAPPAVASVPFAIFCSWLADRWRTRAPFAILQSIVTLVGMILVRYAHGTGPRYFGVFLGTAGCNASLSTVLAWQANNIRGQSTRAIASAMQVMFGAIGGIYASTTFMEKELPHYTSGIWAAVATQLATILMCIGLAFYYMMRNKQANRGERILEGLAEFRYTI
ncbi:MFS general substrate transporter [Eremomyces bilateralis CBS 781.70]|uniref:MFS general substrate transporter n=1 Tax=Eremomyces bilateralis CBS 781.70 TaxID=1392243 RepID=A0A6G1FVZ6_9PEZI|nr:MFS general substrate transporter [Eremomyces bilateralis CBS 781.70]KAF1809799.1 MFS general substrate transporter [Eremomyces bilateralis CBS 781.70]